jgi:N-acetylmuramoyl-L-alanine amidase
VKVRAATCAAVALAALLASALPARAAATSRPASLSSPAPLVCIDPGHGGPFSNANANHLKERTVNLQIGLELRHILVARGYRVVMTRTTNRALQTADTETWNLKRGNLWDYARDGLRYRDQSIPKDDLTARTRVANAGGADLLISIHCNGANSRRARGAETWASPRDALGRQLAGIVQKALVKRTRLKNRGAKAADFYVLRWTNAPSILVESAFISNRSDAAFLKRKAGRARIAAGIADGVDTWFARTPFRKRMPRVSAPTEAGTAVALSRADLPSASTVVLVRSTQAADFPGVAALAVRLGAPLLLSAESTPTQSTLDEIVRLAPGRVITVGLDRSLDTSGVASSLADAGLPSSVFESIEASDRATLSCRIAQAMGAPGSGRVILVNERDDGAQAAVAPIAALTGDPILLTRDATVGPAAEYLSAYAPAIGRVLSVGSRYKPSPSPLVAPVAILRYSDPARVALTLNKATFRSTAVGSLVPVIVSTDRPGDVLTASTHAARLGQPVVMVAGPKMSPYARLYLTNTRVQTRTFTLFDSRGSMPPIVDAILAKCDHY